MTLRVVSYAINGRGMGHLVRQLAILRWIQRLAALLDVPCEAWVLTSSEADTLARREGVPALKMPSKAMLRDAGIAPTRYLAVARTWVLNAVAGLQPDLLLVDTFPGGSFGELAPALELVPHRVLVARRVREDFAEQAVYQALLPLYQRLIVPDETGTGPILVRERAELPGRDEARAALGVPDGARAVYVTLGGGGEVSARDTLPRLVDDLVRRGWHVVVGAGPLYDGPERRGPGITWLSRYVGMELLPGVDAAVASCGYNTFHELMFVGVPTVFLPLDRIADDQEERARLAERAGAARVARSLDEVPALLEAPGTAAAARGLVPVNGARAAALAALGLVLPEADVALAARLLTPELLGLLRRWTGGASREAPARALALVRLLGGGTPSEHARRRAVLLELADQGLEVPELPPPSTAADGPDRFIALCEAHSVPFDTAFTLVDSLRRKFPAADGPALLAATQTLFPAWAAFDDWMGAVALLRAVPTQRTLSVTRFADQVARWLQAEDDLFDALRSFCRLEDGGARTVGEVLHTLARDAATARAK